MYNLCTNAEKKGPAERTIFLTGATGFLGIHLLRELSRRKGVKIYCLVRGEDQKSAECRLEDCYQGYFNDLPDAQRDRIVVVRGDILSRNLGMSMACYDEISNEADLVLHAAADINLMKDFAELNHTNIKSTNNIIELAKTGKNKEVHYISTLAVCGYPPDGSYRSFSEDDFEYGQFFISSYEETKFESEKMIRQFIKDGGVAKIYRVGHISADSIYGKFQRNIEQNRIFQIIKGMMLLKKIPDNYAESVSFSYVDIVSRGIAGFCAGDFDTPMLCLHIENPQYFSFIKIAEFLNQIGYNIEIVELDVFRKSVSDFEGSQNDKKTVDLMDNWIQRAIDFPRRIDYVHRNSLDLIARYGLQFPKADLEWFFEMIRNGIAAGYFSSSTGLAPAIPILLDTEAV